MKRRWLVLSFETSHEAAELLSDYLLALGAEGVDSQDPEDLRHILMVSDASVYADGPLLQTFDGPVHMRAYFKRSSQGIWCQPEPDFMQGPLTYPTRQGRWLSLAELTERIQTDLARFSQYLPVGRGLTGHQDMDEQAWADRWKAYFKTLHLTPRLVINPSWLTYKAQAHEVVVTLDPGSAFGTGSHESTALCAQLLDEWIQPGADVLDLGTGSGLLAIAAARLGAGRVEAVDIDPRAVQIAQDNAALNQVDILVHTAGLEQVRQAPYDLILANIVADVLIELMPELAAALKPGGRLVLSGIFVDRAQAVKQAVRQAGLTLISSRERNDWGALDARASKGP